MASLFVYGTLMSPLIFQEVCGTLCPSKPARIVGYRRVAILGEHYPAIVPSTAPDEYVDGFLYEGLDETTLAKLDRYEGGEYCRTSVVVTVGEKSVQTEIYLFRSEYYDRLSNQPWEYRDFIGSKELEFHRLCIKSEGVATSNRTSGFEK